LEAGLPIRVGCEPSQDVAAVVDVVSDCDRGARRAIPEAETAITISHKGTVNPIGGQIVARGLTWLIAPARFSE